MYTRMVVSFAEFSQIPSTMDDCKNAISDRIALHGIVSLCLHRSFIGIYGPNSRPDNFAAITITLSGRLGCSIRRVGPPMVVAVVSRILGSRRYLKFYVYRRQLFVRFRSSPGERISGMVVVAFPVRTFCSLERSSFV